MPTSSWTIVTIDIEPPPAVGTDRLPCVSCGAFYPLTDLRRAHLRSSDEDLSATILLCATCTRTLQLDLPIRGERVPG